MKKQIIAAILIFGSIQFSTAFAQVSIPTSLLPADRNADWNPGMNSVGGIPNRTTVCATLSPSGGEDSGRINSAINSCPAGQVVQLSAGTFLNNNYILLNKGVTLRGAGPNVTILNKTNGAQENNGSPIEDYMQNIIVGAARYGIGPNNGSSVNLTSDAQDGAYSVTVASTAGFSPGQYVIVDEDQFNTGTWQQLYAGGVAKNSQVWVGDRILWKRHNPSSGVDDPFPSSLSWFTRGNGNVLGEVKEIASISGNTVTFTTPFHISYRTSHSAQMTGFNSPFVKGAGVENLTMVKGSSGCLEFQLAAESWAKNIECDRWLGHGIDIHYSHKIEVRDSYIHDAVWTSPGGGAYAIDMGSYSSDLLVENNVIVWANKVMVANAGGAGSVVAYNYTDDGHIFYAQDWQEVGINASHYAGSHHVLFEGNYSFNADNDSTHGGSIYHTYFRNHLSGFVKSFPGAVMRTAGAYTGSWWMSYIGNVMGLPGRMSGFVYEDTEGISSPAIWKLGIEPSAWDEDPDPKVLSTILRGGNFDYLTNEVRWHNVAQQSLPNSLYLSSKPAFFGNSTWPWVDPIGGTKLYTLPAKYCFEQGQMPNCMSGGVQATTVSISANPTTVTSGQSSTLTWSSTNATSCTASGGWSGTKATSGTQSTGAVTSSTTFTLTCTGAGGASASQSAQVTVGGGTVVPGDLNLDHIVNSLDWAIMSAAWFSSNATADINQDGQVNSLDFAILSANWFRTW